MDQWLIASWAAVAFLAFGVGWYIFHEERKSRKVLRSGRDAGPDTVETRSRRAF